MRTPLPHVLLILCLVLAVLPVYSAAACTRILYNAPPRFVVVGRSMDWPESTQAVLTLLPRGMHRDGGLLGTERVISDRPKLWVSKYASIVTTVYGLGSADGFNEAGLGMHMLYLTATDFGARDVDLPAIHAGLWGQFVLDNAATVTEALEVLQDIEIVLVEAHGRKATVHLALEDASGDSAIIEYVDGVAVVHHGREYRVMTNDPVYEKQLAMLAEMDFSNPSSETPLPGNVNPRDRFQRASYFLSLLPEMENDREAIAGILAIARNVSVPFGAPYKDFGIYNTEYRTAMDLINRRYFFELTTSPNLIWVAIDAFDLEPGSPVMTLDPDDIRLSGDVREAFRVTRQAPF
ncbi:MAG: linear amide C-N hydrolase [Planctomycetes bacterium]|nr:linear amide C-N hydrolase [Planctomycetota bacterium]